MNTLFTTVCNNKFTNALALLMWSIKQHNPAFKYPLKVYHKGDLSPANRERILRVYSDTVFDDVSKASYQTKIPHYLALETFRETEPDSVVFVDSDIICTGDISELGQIDCALGAALDYDFKWPWTFTARFPFSPLARINTGVFVLNKTHRNQKTYKALYALLEKFPDKRIKGMAWSDQGIMNLLFRRQPKFILPYYYNARKNLFPNSKFAAGREAALRNVRLLHYGGTFKPFLGGLKKAPPHSKHHKYSQLHEVYYDYWNRMVKDLQVDWILEDNAAS